MGGAVAAGNRHSADAGAWALAEGGTCVDAALAATFAAFVTEGPLTGPAGGGFLLLPSRARSRSCSTASSRFPPRGRARWTRSRSTSPTRRRRPSTSARRPSPSRDFSAVSPRRTSGAGCSPGRRSSRPPSSSRARPLETDGRAGIPARDPRSDPAARGRWQAHLRRRRADRRRRSRRRRCSCCAMPARTRCRCFSPELADDLERLSRRGAHAPGGGVRGRDGADDAATLARRRGRPDRPRGARRVAARARRLGGEARALARALGAAYGGARRRSAADRDDTRLRRRLGRRGGRPLVDARLGLRRLPRTGSSSTTCWASST